LIDPSPKNLRVYPPDSDIRWLIGSEENVRKSRRVVSENEWILVGWSPPLVGRRDSGSNTESVESHTALSHVDATVGKNTEALWTIEIKRELAVRESESSDLAIPK